MLNIEQHTQSNNPSNHSEVEDWVVELVESYRQLINDDYVPVNPHSIPFYDNFLRDNEPYLTCEHLLEMCDKVLLFTDTGKRHRWLGYIQGVLTVNGILSVKQEMDKTRTLITGDTDNE